MINLIHFHVVDGGVLRYLLHVVYMLQVRNLLYPGSQHCIHVIMVLIQCRHVIYEVTFDSCRLHSVNYYLLRVTEGNKPSIPRSNTTTDTGV